MGIDVVQQYSNEVIVSLLQKMSEQDGKVFDLLHLLMMNAETGENNQKVILQELGEIKHTTKQINAKMEVALEKLTKLETDFVDLKSENRELEQKIILMTSKLSKLDGYISEEDLEGYYALAQSLYSKWDDLDVLTRKYIPLAEYLYSKLQKYDKPDYSPVILELCIAIENEFLIKIFRKYTLDLVDRKCDKLDVFLAIDRANHVLKDKTGQFVKAISKAAKTKKAEYTLGQMNTILSIIMNDKIVEKSPLLMDFVDYLEKNTDLKNLLNSNYIEKVKEIVNEYRNPSAHPEFMSIEKANKCREIMPERLDYLMDCIYAQ